MNNVQKFRSKRIPVSFLEIGITRVFGKTKDLVIVFTSSHTLHSLHLKININLVCSENFSFDPGIYIARATACSSVTTK